ncbi:hypothetical protein BC828DRAFT_394486 [Blastocladiella britannica]|nr:hypothetical protein BC828DRAFT_394486 [Blastocladiella britannica]
MHQHLDASDPWTLEVEWPAFVPASASPAAGNRTARSMTPTATGTGTHTSRYPASYLRRWSYAQQRGDGYLSPKPQPWSTADPDAITHVDYRDLPPIADLLARAGYDGHNNAMKSVATRSRSHPLPATGALPTSVLDAVARDGLVFFHNVPTSKGDDYVELLARRFGHTLRDTFYGPSWDVKVVPASTNVAYTSVFLGLHMDLMYFEAPPGLQFLHMLRTNVRGGRSLFLDMAHAWQVFACEAPADEVAVLQRVPIHYHYAHAHHHHHHHHHHLESGSTPHWLAHAHPLVSSASSSGMFYAPPFAGPLAPPSPDDVPLWYRAMRRWEDHVRALPMVEIDLRPGDAVLFHNRRVLHGRTAFDADQSQSSPASASASEEETKKHVRHLRGTYVGWDEFADRWRVAQYQK